MRHTKENFRALREMVGISQGLLAKLLHVDVRSVKRWEDPNATAYNVAPDDAWAILEKRLEIQNWAVDTALGKIPELDAMADGRELRAVKLTYYKSAEDCERAHPGEEDWWEVNNATARRIAGVLMDAGVPVEFGFEGLRIFGD